MRKNNQSLRTQGVSLEDNCDSVEKNVQSQFDAARMALRAAAEPILSLPEAIGILRDQDRAADIEKLQPLVECIARDVDTFSGQVNELDKEFTELRNNRPTKKNHLPRFFASCSDIGMRVIEINERILNTATQTAMDVTTLVGGYDTPSETPPAVEEVQL